MKKKKKKEENVLILDFLAHGYVEDDQPLHKKKSLAQGIGVDGFTLLELVPKKGVHLQPLEKAYIGDGKREKIHHINGRIPFTKLTSTAEAELEHALKEIIEEKEDEFINFFNRAQPLNTRTHVLQMLPGVGKKHLEKIVEERRVEDFKSFKDLKERVPMMPEPQKAVSQRILKEIKEEEKHNLFVGK